jgi:hypothetical protein
MTEVVDSILTDLRDTRDVVFLAGNFDDDHPYPYETDSFFECLEHLVMHGVRVTRDPKEPHEAVIVPLIENWKTSVPIQRAIMTARRSRTPILYLNPTTWSLTAS